ncbi:5417_t:CDS:2 [Ambispora leptoticha]|uniref:5417_t:CDS:1 n=1 Tax=Ambispora leptoticha TaxID=144679 RepID=A0A9N8ZBZ7_9GLOM|nr:5417_t:CDS:2 [Ambispora leptoticha]
MDPKTGLPSPSSRRSTISGDEDQAHREGITTESKDWTTIKVIDLVIDQNVIIVDGDTPIEEACDILIKNNISSAPVYDAHVKNFIGMFDWADVMSYLLIVLKKKNIKEQQQKSEEQLTSEFRDLIKLAIQCQPVPVKLASDLSNKNPFYSVIPETSLFQVVELFGSGTHRVAVVDADGNLKGILTQSTVINYLYQNVTHFPQIEGIFPKTVRELGIGMGFVITAQANSNVLDALTMMNKNGLSSIGKLSFLALSFILVLQVYRITDENGMLIGNISMSDIKYILRSDRHSLLWRTCHQFVSHVRSRQGLEDGQDRYPVFDISPNSTIGYAIAKLTATKAHRVWVVDEKMNPVGVVSLTDILSVFAREAGGKPNPSAKRQRSISKVEEVIATLTDQ